jgi:hypothetical protein
MAMDFVPRNLTIGGIPCVCIISGSLWKHSRSIHHRSVVPVVREYPTTMLVLDAAAATNAITVTHLFDTTPRKKKNTEDDEEPDERELVPVRRRK